MAKRVKNGFDYFNLDTQFSSSIRLCNMDMGSDSILVLIQLWQRIYSEQGYYMKLSNEHKKLFVYDSFVKLDINKLNEYLECYFELGIFDKYIYEKYEVLTSDSIQERYYNMCSSAKRPNVEIIKEYLLVTPENTSITKYSIVQKYSENTIVDSISKNNNSEEFGKISENFGKFPPIESNVNESIEENSNVKQNEASQHETFSDLQNTCKEKIEKYEKALIDEDMQNFIDYFNHVNIKEQEIKTAMYDFKLNKMTCDKPQPPYNYKTYKEWFKKYLTDNREKYKHEITFKVVSISDKATREDLHSAFKFYWQNEYTIDFIRERILSGEYPPKKETVHFDNLIKNKLIEVTND